MSWNLGMANFDWIKKNDLSMYQPSRQRANFLLHCRQNCFWETSADLPYTRMDRRNRFYIYEVILNQMFYVSPISLFCIKWNPEKSKNLHTIFLGSQSPLQLKIMDVGIIWQLDMWLTSYLDLDSSLFKLCIFVLVKLLHQMWPALFWRIPLC